MCDSPVLVVASALAYQYDALRTCLYLGSLST